MTGLLAVHLPGTLAGFGPWLAAHWPTAPHGCHWQYGGIDGRRATWAWQWFCGAGRPHAWRA